MTNQRGHLPHCGNCAHGDVCAMRDLVQKAVATADIWPHFYASGNTITAAIDFALARPCRQYQKRPQDQP